MINFGMIKMFSRFIAAIGILGFMAFLVVAFWRPGTWRAERNFGHQLGGDVFDDLPGNTIESFLRAEQELVSQEDFLYYECDLRETKDHEIVIFHDWSIGNLVVNASKDTPIQNLRLADIRNLDLQAGCKIPTLEDILQCASKLETSKPILLEIKVLHSDAGRRKVLKTAQRYRDEFGLQIDFLAFRRNIWRSFPDEQKWLREFHEKGFRIYQAYRPKNAQYDLCLHYCGNRSIQELQLLQTPS